MYNRCRYIIRSFTPIIERIFLWKGDKMIEQKRKELLKEDFMNMREDLVIDMLNAANEIMAWNDYSVDETLNYIDRQIALIRVIEMKEE